MATIVIGGHSRNIGKTGAVCALIAATRQMQWTAIKITQFGHGICSANGKPCGCETADHSVAVTEERNPASGTDSSRYLAAGAVRSLWVRTRQGQLAEAMPRIRAEFARSSNILIESNAVLRFLKPDVYASVLDTTVADFKPTALRYLDRADALLLSGGPLVAPAWPGVSISQIAGIRQFTIAPPNYSSAAFAAFVIEKLNTLDEQWKENVS